MAAKIKNSFLLLRYLNFLFYGSLFILCTSSLIYLQPKAQALALISEAITQSLVFSRGQGITPRIALENNFYVDDKVLYPLILKALSSDDKKRIYAWRLRQSLMHIPFIDDVSVRLDEKQHILFIVLKEKKPLARFIAHGKLSVVDQQGVILTAIDDSHDEKFSSLPLIEGNGALQHLNTVLALDKAWYEKFNDRFPVYSFIYVGERRWDILLKNHTRIQLPQELDGFKEINRLSILQRKGGFLNIDNKILDLRLPTRAFIRDGSTARSWGKISVVKDEM